MIENHLRNIDLNLLVHLELLLDERSVTRAAERAGITQSAMSRALGRLRDQLGDPLLVRAGAQMVPTVRALALEPRVRGALRRLVHEVFAAPEFDPSTDERIVTIGSTDMSDHRFVVPLARRLAAEAPGISLRVLNTHRSPVDALESGALDLLIGVVGDAPVAIRTRGLVTESFACLVRPGHPALRRDGSLDLAGFVAAPHVLVAPRGRPGGYVDTLLGAQGLSRRIAVMVQSFATAPAMVPGTDYVLTLPAGLVAAAAARWNLVAALPPLDIPSYTLGLYWHERWQHDPGHRWLRDALFELADTESLDAG